MSWAHKYYRRFVGLNCKELEYVRCIFQIRWRQQKWLWLAFTPFWSLKMLQAPSFSTHFCHSVWTLSRIVDPFARPGFLHQSGGFGWMWKRVYNLLQGFIESPCSWKRNSRTKLTGSWCLYRHQAWMLLVFYWCNTWCNTYSLKKQLRL